MLKMNGHRRSGRSNSQSRPVAVAAVAAEPQEPQVETARTCIIGKPGTTVNCAVLPAVGQINGNIWKLLKNTYRSKSGCVVWWQIYWTMGYQGWKDIIPTFCSKFLFPNQIAKSSCACQSCLQDFLRRSLCRSTSVSSAVPSGWWVGTGVCVSIIGYPLAISQNYGNMENPNFQRDNSLFGHFQ